MAGLIDNIATSDFGGQSNYGAGPTTTFETPPSA